MNDISKIAVLSFYSFTKIEKPEELLDPIWNLAAKKGLKGTILIAQEGFNGSISGDDEMVKILVDEIINFTKAIEVNIKVNYCHKHPFTKLKVKLKKEIVTMRAGDLDVNQLKGSYIETADWDDFIAQQDVVVIDTRNDYEVEEGSFKNAIDPHTENFKQFPDWVKNNKELIAGKKIAMYCTGGIRCEKSTTYLKKLGYEQVYHLKGGILQYLEDTKNKNDLWQGGCYVFDDRRVVTSELAPSEEY